MSETDDEFEFSAYSQKNSTKELFNNTRKNGGWLNKKHTGYMTTPLITLLGVRMCNGNST